MWVPVTPEVTWVQSRCNRCRNAAEQYGTERYVECFGRICLPAAAWNHVVSRNEPNVIGCIHSHRYNELQATTKTVRIDVVAPSLDYGDAPSTYPVTLAQNGARHTAGEMFLGGDVSVEADGLSSIDAKGDEDDGVTFVTSMVAGQASSVAGVYVIASAVAKLDAWIDFNQDGDWLDSGEQIFTSRSLTVGANWLGFMVPANSSPGTTFARFRMSSSGSLTSTVLANDGEVEDYQVELLNGGDAIAVINTSSVQTVSPPLVVDLGSQATVTIGSELLFRAATSELGRLSVTASPADDTIKVTRSAGAHTCFRNRRRRRQEQRPVVWAVAVGRFDRHNGSPDTHRND